MTRLRVAAGQAAARCGDVAANVATTARLTRRAADEGVRLLVLPEAFLTGYCEDAFRRPPHVADLATVLASVVDEAVAGGVDVVVSTPLDRGDRRTLSSVVVTASGRVHTPYDKQHLSGIEHDHFTPGTHGAAITVDSWVMGLAICYDASFPEHARAAADSGAYGYLVSAAFFPGGEHRRDLYSAARALDNGIYVLFSGLTGECGPARFVGGSAVLDPQGRVLAALGEEEGLAVAELDRDVLETTRARITMHRDRLDSLGETTRY